jgi:ABC-type transport system involved in cytochrome c biogenesis permease subunit
MTQHHENQNAGTSTARRSGRGHRTVERNGFHPAAPPARQPIRRPLWERVLKPLASLRLTVALMATSMLLVYAGTLAQKDLGIWQVVDKYFWSVVVWIPFRDLVPRFLWESAGTWSNDFGFPFIGGKTLAVLLLLNLTAAHWIRFAPTFLRTIQRENATRGEIAFELFKRSGIWLIHGGLVLLLVGETVTRERAEEYRMRIEEGKTASYLEDYRSVELAFIDLSDPQFDRIVVIPGARLQPGATIRDLHLPVEVEIVKFWPNSTLLDRPPANYKPEATRGYGRQVIIQERPVVSGTDPEQSVDTPSVVIRLKDRSSGADLGTWLLSTVLRRPEQRVDLGGKPFEMVLRFKREYLPYSLHLTRFTHDVYEGTDKPRDFRSHIRLSDPEQQTEREVEIYMNAPLRYRGKTFFQSGYLDPKIEGVRGTILQVVDNPGWLIPYISCIIVAVGFVVHFSISLLTFLARTLRESRGGPSVQAGGTTDGPESLASSWRSSAGWAASGTLIAVVLIFTLYLGGVASRNDGANRSGFDLERLRRLPVLSGGRVQPMDTAARTTLRILSGTEEYEDDEGKKHPAIAWYADALFSDLLTSAKSIETRVGPVWEARVFRIDNDQVVQMLGLQPRTGFRYALKEFFDRWPLLEAEVDRARETPKEKRDKYQIRLLELSGKLSEFVRVRSSAILTIPPREGSPKWLSLHDRRREIMDDPTTQRQVVEASRSRLLQRHQLTEEQLRQLAQEKRQQLIKELQDDIDQELDTRLAADPVVKDWLELREAYRSKDVERFNSQLIRFAGIPHSIPAKALAKAQWELFYNRFAPFYQSMGLYVVVCVLCLLGFLLWAAAPRWSAVARWPALGLLILAFGVHTLGLVLRMYIQGRPPVTNLYSSAIFIGWGAVFLSLILELIYSYGVASLVGGLIGFCSCLIAHYLSKTTGDTLEMLQAVLDTNFWLATHVTTITFGYVASYVAGVMGIVYLTALTIFSFRSAGQKPLAVLSDVPFLKSVHRMLYGVVCFATMLSFIGTVLGGIWADQSWGRFWGWDPKENGAVLVVIWNALILHARWAGLVRSHGIAVLAVLGNVVTTWSWFGTNMLGVGLHSYGFSNELYYMIVSVSLVSLFFAIAGGVLPKFVQRLGKQMPSAVPS